MGWRLGLAFATGALISVATPWLPPAQILIPVAVAALLAAFAVPAARVLLAAVLGACWFLGHAQLQMVDEWPESRAGETLRVVGRVVGLPEHRGQSVRFVVEAVESSDQSVPSRIQVSWFRPRAYVQPGEVWDLSVRMRPPRGRLNPGGFDLRRHLLAERIGAVATVQGRPVRLESGAWRGGVDRQRMVLSERLQAETSRLDHASLLRALGLADRSGMTIELRELLQRTGTAHLLAISGLHIGMVAGMAALVFGWLLSPLLLWPGVPDRRRIAIGAGLAAALGYAWLAGFTLPTVRALIMLGVAGAALALRRGVRPAHALVLAVLAVILVDPTAPLATGFWLSFSAVAVLIWAFAWRPGGAGQGWLRSLLVAQLVIAVGLLPLNIGVFSQWIPGAIIANLIAIPLVGLWVLPLLLVTLLLMLAGLPAGLPIAGAEAGLQWLLQTLEWVDGQRWSHRPMAGGGLAALVAAMLGALWLLAPPGWPGRWLGGLLMLPLLIPADRPVDRNALDLFMLDVGDGQAIVLETAGHRLLYDTGPGDGEGRDSIRSLLSGVNAAPASAGLHGLVVSRPHRGHAGGLGSARPWAHPLRVRVAPGMQGSACRQGETWELGRYRVSFLHPSGALPDLGDNSSCVVRIAGPGGSVLLSGAVDGQVEQRLLLDHPGLSADVLVLSAGGHRRAAGEGFLAQISPQLALASVDRHDRFGRPHPEVVERVEQVSARLLSTGACGAIRIRLAPGRSIEVETERGQSRRFWIASGDCP